MTTTEQYKSDINRLQSQIAELRRGGSAAAKTVGDIDAISVRNSELLIKVGLLSEMVRDLRRDNAKLSSEILSADTNGKRIIAILRAENDSMKKEILAHEIRWKNISGE